MKIRKKNVEEILEYMKGEQISYAKKKHELCVKGKPLLYKFDRVLNIEQNFMHGITTRLFLG